MSGHTPGPWVAALGPGDVPVVLRDGGEREQIATVTAYFARPDKSAAGRGWSHEGPLNAALLAAAPDLLAALEALEAGSPRMLDADGEVVPSACCCVDYCATRRCAHTDARAAIAKARGK